MIFDCALIAAGHKDKGINSSCDCFFSRILISGLSTIGNNSLGIAFVAGKKRVPNPATGKTAFQMVVISLPKPLCIFCITQCPSLK
jgi:hypothetical protein